MSRVESLAVLSRVEQRRGRGCVGIIIIIIIISDSFVIVLCSSGVGAVELSGSGHGVRKSSTAVGGRSAREGASERARHAADAC